MTLTDEIREAKAGATPGPWVYDDENQGEWGVNFSIQQKANILVDVAEMVGDPYDASLIALAPRMAEIVLAADALMAHAIAAHDELALWFECADDLEKAGFDMGDTERAMNALDRALTALRTTLEDKT